jgi:hypothetical protein
LGLEKAMREMCVSKSIVMEGIRKTHTVPSSILDPVGRGPSDIAGTRLYGHVCVGMKDLPGKKIIFRVNEQIVVEHGEKLTKFAKASFIIWALHPPFFRMSIQTFVTSRTIPVFCEPPAFWHTSQVILVQKFAYVSLFT